MNRLFIFITGITIGSVTTGLILKRHYETIIDTEIQSVKDRYSEKSNTIEEIRTSIESDKDDKEKIATEARTKPDLIKHAVELSNKNNYKNYSNSNIEEEKTIYVIHPDDYGEKEDYETITLYYYSDDIVADEEDEEVENPEKLLGDEFREFFETSEDDSLYVRNNYTCSDYEILRSAKTFDEVRMERYPYNLTEE